MHVYCVLNPNNFAEYVVLNLRKIVQSNELGKISYPRIEHDSLYFMGYKKPEYSLFIVSHGQLRKIIITDSIRYSTSLKLFSINDFWVAQIGEYLYFISKKDLTVKNTYSRVHYDRPILTYKDGVILSDLTSYEVVFCTNQTNQVLFKLPRNMLIRGWYIPQDVLLVDNLSKEKIQLVNMEGEIVGEKDKTLVCILDYEKNNSAYLATMIPKTSNLFNMRFELMDVIRSEVPAFYQPFIQDMHTYHRVILPSWAGMGIWNETDFDKESLEDLQKEIESITY